MIARALPGEERRALVELLAAVVTSEREASGLEIRFIIRLADHLGVAIDHPLALAGRRTLEEICGSFDTLIARRIALAKCLELAFVDDLYREDAWVGLGTIADMVPVEPPEPDSGAQAWVR